MLGTRWDSGDVGHPPPAESYQSIVAAARDSRQAEAVANGTAGELSGARATRQAAERVLRQRGDAFRRSMAAQRKSLREAQKRVSGLSVARINEKVRVGHRGGKDTGGSPPSARWHTRRGVSPHATCSAHPTSPFCTPADLRGARGPELRRILLWRSPVPGQRGDTALRGRGVHGGPARVSSSPEQRPQRLAAAGGGSGTAERCGTEGRGGVPARPLCARRVPLPVTPPRMPPSCPLACPQMQEVQDLARGARSRAEEALGRSQAARSRTEKATAQLRDFIRRIKAFLAGRAGTGWAPGTARDVVPALSPPRSGVPTEEGADPGSIELVARHVLNISLPSSPGRIQELLQEIQESIGQLDGVDAVLNSTAQGLAAAKELLAQGQDAR